MSTGKKRFVAYLVMMVSLLISVKLVKDIIKLRSADKRLIDAETELLLAKQEQAELKKRLLEFEDKSWWEKRVRNVLKMAKPGEVVVVVPDEVISQNSPKDISDANQTDTDELSNWQKWRRIFID